MVAAIRSPAWKARPAIGCAVDRWLFGPWLDLVVGCGLGYVVLLPFLLGFGYATGVHEWPVAAVTAIALLLAAPHYGATVLRIFENREDRAKYQWFALSVTVALALVFAGATRSVWLASASTTIYMTWSPWHFAGQNYGLGLMFLRRRGVEVDARTKRLFYLSFVLSAVLAMLAIHGRQGEFSVAQSMLQAPGVPQLIVLGIPASALGWLLAVVGSAYLACLAAVAWRLRGRGTRSDRAPAWILVATQALWFAVPALARGDRLLPFDAVWVSAAHSVQYLWITAYYAKRARPREHGGFYLVKALAAGTAVTSVPALLFAPDLLGGLPWDAGLDMVSFSLVNIHHFILDGAIWKLRDGAIARVLLRPPAPAEGDTARSRGSALGALVWGVAALSLVVPALSLYEAIGMSRDSAPERIAQAQQHLRWIGRESVARHVEVGRKSELAGHAESALEHYRRSVELFPNVAGWDGLAGLYARQQQFALALDANDRAMALYPESARLLFRRAQIGLAQAQNGTRPDPELRETIAALRHVLELQPAHAPASLLLAQLIASAGRREEAVAILERAVERAGNAPSPTLRRRLAELQRSGWQ